ncbi:glycerophosphodiester phosphodiesterase [Bacillus cereus group sp. Bce018]|uniref:glycerophosphodiester phosphodiesterase n=1 Tax=Bacillus cereus group sp. Bce018 TaxID=3445248 RepID=UPI003F295A03
MADAPLVLINDDLPDGVPKINHGIQNANEALRRSYNAEKQSNIAGQKATAADALSKSVQNQLTSIVVEGDSSVEAAQARTDVNGKTSGSLKERLDDNQMNVIQIEEKVHADRNPEVIAHRGFLGSFPENTLTAFTSAIARGADALEMDVQFTKDGIPVVIHDETVDRTTNGTGRVDSLTLAEIQALDAGSKFHSLFSGTRIPTLENVLYETGKKAEKLYIEIKSAKTIDDIQKVVDMIFQFGIENRCIIASFNMEDIVNVRKLYPTIKVAFVKGGLPSESEFEKMKELGNVMFQPDYVHVLNNKAYVEKLYAAGIDISVWTVNNMDHVDRLAKNGVFKIITNNYFDFG